MLGLVEVDDLLYRANAELARLREERDQLAEKLELRAKLVEIDTVRRRVDEAVVGKKKTMDEHDKLFLHTARSFESYCRLAGEDELADRVRPSERRAGRTEVEPDEDVPADGGAGSQDVVQVEDDVPEADASVSVV